jgi:RNA polymerase primary sigma factor
MRPLKITQSITHRETESFNKYLESVSKLDLITPDIEVELAKRIKLGDQKATDQLIEANLRFVISVAKQYVGRGLTLEDLVSEGNIGLIKAAQKFDESKGIKFISYAVWWIRQSIIQSLADNSRIIRLPVNQIATLNKIKSAQNDLESRLGRPATSEELSEYLQIDLDKIELSLKSSKPVSSLDMTIGEDDWTILDGIASDSDTSDLVNISDMKLGVLSLMSKLNVRERIIIEGLFGLTGAEKSLGELATELDISVERVRQIKKVALNKMRLSKIKI